MTHARAEQLERDLVAERSRLERELDRLTTPPIDAAGGHGRFGDDAVESAAGASAVLQLRAGTDSLYGDVTMIDPRGQTIRSADPSGVHAMHVSSPQRLRIDFVAIRADSIRGVLEPYVSPDCDCTVSTTFVGQARGTEIKGTFVSRSGGRVRAEGQWEMRRVGDGK